MRLTFAGSALLLFLTGCASVPSIPSPVAPSTAVGAFAGARLEGVTGSALPANWWRLFEDPVLDGHVQRALAANADLRVAIANLEIARAQARQAEASRLPQTVVESGAGPDRADQQPSTSSLPKTSYELGATVAYEIDLFGRLRSAALAAGADAEAVQAALESARVAVVADTVAAYVDLCAANANAALAARQVAAQQKSLDLVADQLAAGEVSPLEVSQARLLREQVAATAAPFEADRKRALFRLAVLQGRPAAEAETFPAGCAAAPRIGLPLPVGDGAALIARRPDIREADRRLAAAGARVGVATADLYPRIQLGGSAGLIAGGFDGFLTPLITWAFPNQGPARARLAAAKGSAEAALANWDRVMLRALGEVETALADYQAEGSRRASLTLALAEAEQVLKRANARQRLGADNYLLVLDAERSRNTAASQLVLSEARIAQTQVAIFRALGGGWEAQPVVAIAREDGGRVVGLN
ncbi:efflux transporter outer membrane subunit [Phenylobacterium immobile]|uniref:efflux transporter outer membrane subunit n=1 Tax=Phenylobacterium immobile TaxID=21 RepID=UPI000ABDB73D|nr:efflux transporter outer membrane subunit [Phenylobacterium immobile]